MNISNKVPIKLVKQNITEIAKKLAEIINKKMKDLAKYQLQQIFLLVDLDHSELLVVVVVPSQSDKGLMLISQKLRGLKQES